jgi:catechol 2,3-dioxygenase-like lactoylglutathione lyase family enzyme
MNRSLVMLSLLVRDYDEAIRFYTQVMQFELLEDEPRGPDKRWVVVAPPGGVGGKLLLAKAANEPQRARVGDQTGGRVFLFLHTDDFWRDYRHLASHSIVFTEQPREESYGTVVVFLDLYGNKWDLIQLAAQH